LIGVEGGEYLVSDLYEGGGDSWRLIVGL